MDAEVSRNKIVEEGSKRSEINYGVLFFSSEAILTRSGLYLTT